jgi:hypothetical protein
MNAEEQVKANFPYAYAYEFAGPKPWVIYETAPGDPSHRGNHLSRGCATREEAWTDALKRIGEVTK